MDEVNPYAVFDKLDENCFQTLNNAVALAIARTHYKIEIEHWLVKLFESPDAVLQTVIRQYDVDRAQLSADLNQKLDRFKTGNEREGAPPFSPTVLSLIQRGWGLASLRYGESLIRSVHLLCAALLDEVLAPYAREISQELKRIDAQKLAQDLPWLTQKTREIHETAEGEEPRADIGKTPTGKPLQKALDQFTIDLTQRAQAGEIDPIVGRDKEIRQIIDILTRRRQNNPILTGEAGVGKTAVVEGFALRVAAGDVPPLLRNISLRNLDLGLLQAGAGVRGEFENRMKSVIEEVKASPRPVVLFIDEAHMLIGAGGAAGQGDAANMLKPALARGELRTIAATTWAEYKKYFEQDAALTRRFQVIKVEEPTETEAVDMMRGLVTTLEKHHRVKIRNEAVVEAVRLSHRYISGRQLPEKAVSLLDTAGARVALSQTATPAEIEDRRRGIQKLDVEVDLLEREAISSSGDDEQTLTLRKLKGDLEREIEDLELRWEQEKKLISEIDTFREKIEKEYQERGKLNEDTVAAKEELKTQRTELVELEKRFYELQGDTPLVYKEVNAQAVAEVVAAWTGIPVGRMVADEIRAILNLKETLRNRVVGQDHALEIIAQTMRTSRARLGDPRKPIGVFLMVGPSGVGKTETALALAEQLYGGEDNVTVINMSEFKEAHKVATLMGAPPGYVGYGRGGVLTEAVRRRPYSVILLDEMEKAHRGVQDVFYQVFDKGHMHVSEGRDIDFKNTVIIMTSNAGAEDVMMLCEDPELRGDDTRLAEMLQPRLMRFFKPAFLGRVTLVPYYPLEDEVLKKIVELNLERVRKRVEQNYRAAFSYSPEVIDNIRARCRETETGARVIEHILNRALLPELADHFLSAMVEGQSYSEVRLLTDDIGGFKYQFSQMTG